ncbi:MAG: sulfite exporter TauE/SafE family protein [Ignavibacteriales bacterium]|nr:sulfite exporter TauE/SafE family protein [Ignavibacteriales bacterium]
MEEWIRNIANADITSASMLPAAFLLGMLGAFSSCCNFAVIGAIAGYSGKLGNEQKKKTIMFSSISFLIGTVISLGLIGALSGYISHYLIQSIGNYWKIAAGILSILFGLATLNWFQFKLPSVKTETTQIREGILPALIFGLAIGGLSTACNTGCNPLFPIVIGASFLKGGAFWGALMLVLFALGYGLPLTAAMIGIGWGSGKISLFIDKFNIVLQYASGFLLITIGFYLIVTL